MKNFLKRVIHNIKQLIFQILAKINVEKQFGKGVRFLSRHFKWVITFFVALSLADLCVLLIWPLLLPGDSVEGKKPQIIKARPVRPSRINFINSKNIFHRGPIPEHDSLGQGKDFSSDGMSVPSNLPFKLLGTLVSDNAQYSMASVFVQSTQKSDSYFTGDIIDNKAQVKNIKRRKVILLNLNNDRLEHLEIPIDKKALAVDRLSKDSSSKSPFTLSPEKKLSSYEGITEVKENEYSVNRSIINDHLQNLPDILQQARTDPKLDTNGEVIGHTFKWILKDSVFRSLGFEKGDTIISVNGEKVNDKTEAAELFQKFRASSQFHVMVEDKKDGKVKNLSYNIDEDASVQ